MATIVDQIRKALEKRDGISVEAMSPLADAYSEQVTRINDRLGEAVGLLRKGLRSEAIQLASLNPNAIDGAADLDFPEIADWLEILQFLDIPVPTQVDQDAALQLNEAIVETQPLNELLCRHRRLAIARAPLAWRLNVLRRIAHVDPTNTVWEEDLETWEDARLKQIPAELKAAVENQDTDAVALLGDELTKNSWRVNPPVRLVEKVTAAADQFSHNADSDQLMKIAPQLHDAFGQFDETLARSLRDNWRAIQTQMKMPIAIDLQEQVAPALAWLDERDRELATIEERAVAIATLETALDNGNAPNDLRQTYQRACQFEEPIPIELDQRFRVTIAEHELRSKRKMQAIIVSIVAATLLLGGWIGYRQWSSQKQQRVASAIEQLESLVVGGQLTEAEQFLEQLNATQPKIAATSAINSLENQLEGKLATERERTEQFESYLQVANNDDPAMIEMAALRKADALAVSDNEKGAVFEIQRKRSQWERQLESEHSQAVLKLLGDHRTELDRIEKGAVDIEAVKAIKVVVDRVNGMSAVYPRRSRSANQQLELVKKRAKAIDDALREQSWKIEAQTTAMERLINSHSLADFSDSLEAYARNLPKSPISKEFQRSAKEEPQWEAFAETNQTLALLQQSIAGGINPTEAKLILASHQKMVDDVVENPAFASMQSIVGSLEKVKDRDALLDKVFEEIMALAVSEMVTMVVANGDSPAEKHRYFVYSSHYDRYRDRFNVIGTIGVEVVVNASAAVKNKSFKTPVQFIQEPQATFEWLREEKEDRRKEFLSDWDGAFLKTAADLIKRPKLDGYIKELLLQQLLIGGATGSDYLAKSTSDARKQLDRRRNARNRWFEPRPLSSSLDPNVKRDVLPILSQAYSKRPSLRQKIQSVTESKYEWIGFLNRDKNGTVSAQLQKRPTTNGIICVARAAASDPEKVDIVEVGTWENGKITLDRSGSDLVAGRPIFFLPH